MELLNPTTADIKSYNMINTVGRHEKINLTS